MKIAISLGALALCLAGSAAAQVPAKAAPAADPSDREWKLNLLALQVENRTQSDCYGHGLSADNVKVCIDFRMTYHARKIAAITGLRPAGVSADSLSQDLVLRAQKIDEALSQ
ncbi:hypothetical protein [Burkholderia sp. Ac-20365]|uniref:hypothetical protein n=1 Tax=Burkholderia sp. Ac-20365 TaxID=2703897 RepID=UPI00197BDAA6|nr:hypothetical protein [Burkholderia sp. Ac-20365]MBN3760924.1 hypothetical protein [Burkholderia sp. Ac-20365]